MDQASAADTRHAWDVFGPAERERDDDEHDDDDGSCPDPLRASCCHHQKVPVRGAVLSPRLGSLGMDATSAASRAAGLPFHSALPEEVDELWEDRAGLGPDNTAARKLITDAVDLIDAGVVRVAQVDAESDNVVVDERAKRAILLAFRVMPMVRSTVGDFRYHDRVPLTSNLDGVRAVAGAIVRWGAYVAPGAVLMPSFVNIGAYVDSGTMVDAWATVGSCAQIGKNVHVSGGAGIGGVLEPPNAVPVVVEDEAFIGSRSMVVMGARVRTGAVVGAGTILTPTTHVIDVETGEELPMGEAPAWSVCVSGTRTREFPGGTFGMQCVLVLKRLKAGERHDKSKLNEVLRDHGVDA
jgi:2,3,4,5-tetrahydropyridine-2,6-dicarboxylate N-succinyltransferase